MHWKLGLVTYLILVKSIDSCRFELLEFLQAVHLLLGNTRLFDHTTS